MMFKLLQGVLTVLFLGAVIVFGVRFSAAPDKPAALLLNIETGCEDIRTITCEYSFGGEPQGGKDVRNAKPDTPIPVGDSVCFGFTPEYFEFPEKLSSEEFSISFFVTDMDGEEYYAGSWSGSVSFAEEYFFMLYRENGEFRTEQKGTMYADPL